MSWPYKCDITPPKCQYQSLKKWAHSLNFTRLRYPARCYCPHVFVKSLVLEGANRFSTFFGRVHAAPRRGHMDIRSNYEYCLMGSAELT